MQMITDIRKNNIKQYVESFRLNPERFANKLTKEQVKFYGVCNNEFWKSFIVNIDKMTDDSKLEEIGLYENLARIYFVTGNGERRYLVEKFTFDLKPHNKQKILELAQKLKKEGVEVDLNSAILIDKQNQTYKFTRYQIIRN